MSTKNWTYPRYLKTEQGLIAFTAPDKMFMITNQGRNMNPGISIDHFITRRMVLKHSNDRGQVISAQEFTRLYNAIFFNARQKMMATHDTD